ncbi:LuxR family transcriptional regulator [Inquilinus sp. CAU 1745]|uniref:helix-turn-helix transcriptional regulator n=1 Tax=Inquilinus sp. CAU 1745 TaxID=3140369 RepID=UPI00325A6D40
MRSSVDDFIEGVARAGSLKDIRSALEKQTEALGFDRYAYLVVRPPEGPRVPFVLTNYPEEWADRYAEQRYVSVDPIIPTAATSMAPFRWEDILRQPHAGGAQKMIINEATEIGLRNGVTVPIHGPGSGLATLSVAADVPQSRFDALWAQRRHELHLVAVYAHEQIVRHVYSDKKKPLFKLSPRERECLLWTSRGKTAWEVCEILGISHETVTDYLKSAARKLGVYSKTHAVVRAIMLGLIVP